MKVLFPINGFGKQMLHKIWPGLNHLKPGHLLSNSILFLHHLHGGDLFPCADPQEVDASAELGEVEGVL